MSNKIMVLMLVTGEELIGEVKETVEKKTTFTMVKPRVVAIMRSPDGRQGLGLVPWCKSNLDATVEIAKNQIIATWDAVKEVESAYLQETSGIQLASSMPPETTGQSIIQ